MKVWIFGDDRVGNHEEDYEHEAEDKDANNANKGNKVEEFNQEASWFVCFAYTYEGS